MKKILLSSIVTISLLAATPQLVSARDRNNNAMIGAAVGLLGGALLSNGDPWATVAGAAAGGAIGHLSSNDRRDNDRRHSNRSHQRDDRSNWRNDRHHRSDRRNDRGDWNHRGR